MSSEDNNHFRVIISGGGIAGLTLANALQLGGIDFVLLERRNNIAPQVGASIGILPNGARIIDQLGCYEEILELVEPLDKMAYHRADGSIIQDSDTPELMVKRSGYDTVFLGRQSVLEVLARHVDPKKILLEKEVASVENRQDMVVVRCKDGTEFTGDILAGADGVNSKTRHEMWRIANAESPGVIPAADIESMFSEYECMFGISSRTEGLKSRYINVTHDQNVSSMVLTGKEERVYWFIFQKLPRICRGNEIPKYTREDADAFGEEVAGLNIQPNGAVQFCDIWKNRTSYSRVALEEAQYNVWTWGRIACLGDSIHKMTPNSAHGGNCAMESAAALANVIKAMADKAQRGRPTYQEVKNCLKNYQNVREKRASEVMKAANKLTRIHAMKTFGDYLFAHWIGPALGDSLVEMHSASVSSDIREPLLGTTRSRERRSQQF